MTSIRRAGGSAASSRTGRLVLGAVLGLSLLIAAVGAAAWAIGRAPAPRPRSGHSTAARAASLRAAGASRPPPAPAAAAAAGAGSADPVGRGGPIPFRRDACLAFAPTGRPNGATVFLDPGHGGTDPGAIARADGRIVTEKQVTLAIARRALPLLRRDGYRVVMSRTGDTTVARLRAGDVHGRVMTPAGAQREIEARNLCADAARATVLVALHMNAFSQPSARGAEAFYCPSRPFAARSRRLAAAVQHAVVTQLRRAGMSPENRGVLPDRAGGGTALTPQTADYHHLIELGPADRPWLPDPSRMPGVLLEPAFLSNPGDAAFLVSARGQRALAHALVAGLDTYRHVAPSP